MTLASLLIVSSIVANIIRLFSRNRKSFRSETRYPRGLRRGRKYERIAVIGAGAWGTGLAIVLGRKGTHRVRLWAHENEVCESIANRRVNETISSRPPDPGLCDRDHDLSNALAGAQIVVSVMPSQHCRRLFERMRPLIPARSPDRHRD